MLREVFISNHATYPAEGTGLHELKAINFIFGTNGSGKTTISRVIADPLRYPTCLLTWSAGDGIDRLVYNCDFAAQNFTSHMPGIFTLGEDDADLLKRINAIKDSISSYSRDIEKYSNDLNGSNGKGGKADALTALKVEFYDKCWKLKGKYDGALGVVFTGFKGSKVAFGEKIIKESLENTAQVRPYDELKIRTARAFDKGIQKYPHIIEPDFSILLYMEQEEILAKIVVGKSDIDAAKLIDILKNSDWVKEGLEYLNISSHQCPFCQREMDIKIIEDIQNYFDESYNNDIKTISLLSENYQNQAQSVIHNLRNIISSMHPMLNSEKLTTELDALSSLLDKNIQEIGRKKSEPSLKIRLSEALMVIERIRDTINSANKAISDHNEIVDNLSSEKETLSSEIWKFLVTEISDSLSFYTKESTGLSKAVAGIGKSISEKKLKVDELKADLRKLEKRVTSVQPTVDDINSILESFGFTNFRLRTSGEKENFYEIVRSDGENATKTLSEGEKSFITFLYFYHLVRGSTNSAEVSSDRVVVIDDPVSSLDSEVLFIVSTLIKRLLEEACVGTGHVKQVLILTHNIYFHKEVSFDPKRGSECRTHETFWIVRKRSNITRIDNYSYNPIKTSYELLWDEVKNPEKSGITIQNTLRRIIENYFKILGNIDKDDIVKKFSGKDQQICSSLFAWVNDGSHNAHDELYISADDTSVERYLAVFKTIFKKTEHWGHYVMMMGGEDKVTVDEDNQNLPVIEPAPTAV